MWSVKREISLYFVEHNIFLYTEPFRLSESPVRQTDIRTYGRRDRITISVAMRLTSTRAKSSLQMSAVMKADCKSFGALHSGQCEHVPGSAARERHRRTRS